MSLFIIIIAIFLAITVISGIIWLVLKQRVTDLRKYLNDISGKVRGQSPDEKELAVIKDVDQDVQKNIQLAIASLRIAIASLIISTLLSFIQLIVSLLKK